MTLESASIVVYALLIVTLVAAQAGHTALTAGLGFGLSNRDEPRPGMGPVGHRIDRTLANLEEGALQYLPLALLAVALDITNGWTAAAALVTMVSRVLYVPVYLSGVPVLRTVIWTPGFLAIPAMAIGVLAGPSS